MTIETFNKQLIHIYTFKKLRQIYSLSIGFKIICKTRTDATFWFYFKNSYLTSKEPKSVSD